MRSHGATLRRCPLAAGRRARKFERVLQRYAWHAQNSQIYPELNQLRRDGLADVVEEGPRGRRTYAITEAGRAELRRWMRNPPDVFTVRNEFVLRLFLLPALEPDEARAVLHQLAAESGAALATLQKQADKFDAAAAPGSALPLNRLVAEFGLRSYQTLQDRAGWALGHIGEKSGGRLTGGELHLPAAQQPGGKAGHRRGVPAVQAEPRPRSE